MIRSAWDDWRLRPSAPVIWWLSGSNGAGGVKSIDMLARYLEFAEHNVGA
jgi:hypothetical protein